MLKEERHQFILDRLHAHSRVYITALSEELGVSDDTLRRDLGELDKQGLLTKVHGGAIAKSGALKHCCIRKAGNGGQSRFPVSTR